MGLKSKNHKKKIIGSMYLLRYVKNSTAYFDIMAKSINGKTKLESTSRAVQCIVSSDGLHEKQHKVLQMRFRIQEYRSVGILVYMHTLVIDC